MILPKCLCVFFRHLMIQNVVLVVLDQLGATEVYIYMLEM